MTANNLPELSAATLPGYEKTIIIKRGEPGYFETGDQRPAEEINDELGVTKAQAEAMFAGSMFGWHVPGADPANYDETGKCNI